MRSEWRQETNYKANRQDVNPKSSYIAALAWNTIDNYREIISHKGNVRIKYDKRYKDTNYFVINRLALLFTIFLYVSLQRFLSNY
jgi:hypothetical protein